MKKTVLMLYGVWGEDARQAVTRSLQAVPGVHDVIVNIYRAQATIVHDDGTSQADLIHAVTTAGFLASACDALPRTLP